MSFIILIPALASVVALFFWSPGTVFRNITLPVVLLCPNYFYWKVAMLPPVDFADAVFLPLGIGICLYSLRLWRLTWLDVAMGLFVLSSCASDRMTGHTTASTFELFDSVCRGAVPYLAGRLLIEQEGKRAATLRRIVVLMFAGVLVAVYEFFAKANPYKIIFQPFFKGEVFALGTQIRSGYGRLSGPFSDAEVAGMMLTFGILATMWLARYQDWGRRIRDAHWFPLRKSTLVAGALLGGLMMTQSRGPELGLVFGLPVALVGRSKRVVRSALIAAGVLLVAGVVGSLAISRYSATKSPTSDEQQTAIYRALLIKNYLPMALHDGAFGYGPNFPRMGERESLTGVQDSIDNQYLFVTLTQGYVGFFSFVFMCLATVYHLTWAGIYNPAKSDRAFAFTLLGIFVAGLVTIATVYLGFQTYVFFFLMVGWAQAVRAPKRLTAAATFEAVYS